MTAIPIRFSAQYSSCLTNHLGTCPFQVCSSLDSGQLLTMKPEQKARCATYKNKNFSVYRSIIIMWNVIYIANYKLLNLIQPVEPHGFSLGTLHRKRCYLGDERLFRIQPIPSRTCMKSVTLSCNFFASINFPFSSKRGEGMKHRNGFKHPFVLI